MMYPSLQFRIDQMRKTKASLMIESISVFIFSLVLTIYLPQLLYKYFYANQELLEEPKIMGYIPLISFVIGVGYFAYAMIMSIMMDIQIKKSEKELANLGGCTCGQKDCPECGEVTEMAELAEKVIKKAAKKKTKKSKK